MKILVLLMFSSPLIASIGVLLFFAIEKFRLQQKLHMGFVAFTRYVAVWGICGFGLAFLFVLYLSIVTESHQAPLGLLRYGLFGMALGEVLGAAIWRRNALKPNALKPRSSLNSFHQEGVHPNILVFSDGTGNSSGKLFRTNVWRLYKAVDLADPQNPREPRQFAYYDDGVGTSSFRPLALLGGAIGVGLARNVRDLYAFVCRTYRPGDKIYAFGFSRGAFTVRVLVGLILNQGIVQYNGSEADLKRDVKNAYRAYRRERCVWRGQVHVKVARWLRDLVIECLLGKSYNKLNNIHFVDGKELKVEFVGVWDTVAAYGLPIDELTRAIDFIWPLSMPDRNLNRNVNRAMHALSLDDERNTFHPQLWNEGPPPKSTDIPAPNEGRPTGTIKCERLSQVWFAGVHSDVGGGYPDDSLSYVPLEWMMTGAKNAGVRFSKEICLDYLALSDENGPIHDSRRGLAGYYRYNPRRIERLTHTKEVTIEQIKIHESVLRHIRVGQDGYAPIVPPPDFNVARINGTIVPGQNYLNVPLDPASPYAVSREHVFNWVWWRRIAYFGTLFSTIALVLAPLPKGACESRFCFASEWINVLSFVLPGFASTWIDTFASHPNVFFGIGLLILIGLYFGSLFDLRIHDAMRRVWYAIPATQPETPGPFPVPVSPSAVNGRIQWLRTQEWYQDAFRVLTDRLMPAFFLLVVVLYVAPALVTRLVFSIQDSFGCVCIASGSPQDVTSEPSQADFKTNTLCSPTGLMLAKGGTYRLRFEIPAGDPWIDKNIPAGPNGVYDVPLPVTLVMTAGVPFRRHLTQPWFKPMARIRNVGNDDYALDPKPSLPEREIRASKGTKLSPSPSDIWFESEIVARSSGELFLYVNDAYFNRFYDNNRGSARVTVQLVTAPPP
jgi:uncharacterized protein (DUF2235 family)